VAAILNFNMAAMFDILLPFVGRIEFQYGRSIKHNYPYTVMVATGCIAAEQASFSRQMAPIAHPKPHLDGFSRFCTIHLCDQHTCG